LLIDLRTWVRTVSGEMKRLLPICSFERPSASQSENLPLALRERGKLVRHRRTREHAGEHRVDVGAARRDGGDRPQQIAERRLLQDEAAGARVERLGEECALAVAGVEDHAGLRAALPGLACDLDAAAPGHPQVDERHGRPSPLDRRDRVRPVDGPADDLAPALLEVRNSRPRAPRGGRRRRDR